MLQPLLNIFLENCRCSGIKMLQLSMIIFLGELQMQLLQYALELEMTFQIKKGEFGGFNYKFWTWCTSRFNAGSRIIANNWGGGCFFSISSPCGEGGIALSYFLS